VCSQAHTWFPRYLFSDSSHIQLGSILMYLLLLTHVCHTKLKILAVTRWHMTSKAGKWKRLPRGNFMVTTATAATATVTGPVSWFIYELSHSSFHAIALTVPSWRKMFIWTGNRRYRGRNRGRAYRRGYYRGRGYRYYRGNRGYRRGYGRVGDYCTTDWDCRNGLVCISYACV